MNKTVKIIVVVVLALTLFLAGCGGGVDPAATGTATGIGIRVGQQAPDFQLQSLDGKTVSLSDFRGQPVLLNFWASWCGPCIGEMPDLQSVYDNWTDKGLQMLAVNVGEGPLTVVAFVKGHKYTMPVLLDTGNNVSRLYGVTGIPTTYLIDKDGIIRDKVIGAFPNEKTIEQHLGAIVP
jgi:peroxiredoxin